MKRSTIFWLSWLIGSVGTMVLAQHQGRRRLAHGTAVFGGTVLAEPARRDWREIVIGVKDRMAADATLSHAAGVAFFAFLAIPPGLAALISLYGLAFDAASIQGQILAMRGLIPIEALDVISKQLTWIASKSDARLSTSLLVSVAIALWSSRACVATLMTALNIAYGDEEGRGYFLFFAVSLGLTACAILFALISLGLVALLPILIGFLPLGEFGKTVASLARWPVLVALMLTALAALYRFAPTRGASSWHAISLGSALATLVWVAASAGFSLYAAHFGYYDKTYGSLGAIVVLLLWLYLSAFSVLLGAELDAGIQRGGPVAGQAIPPGNGAPSLLEPSAIRRVSQ